MTLSGIIKQYGGGKGEKAMWAVTNMLSDYLERHTSEEEYCGLCKRAYYEMAGGHYNKAFADEQIPKMFYKDDEGEHYAPYWTEGVVEDFFDLNKKNIPPEYNFYDFEVALNMIKSDYKVILGKWYDENPADMDRECWIDKKCVDLAVNWLDDEDNPFGTEKVWRYFNS